MIYPKSHTVINLYTYKIVVLLRRLLKRLSIGYYRRSYEKRFGWPKVYKLLALSPPDPNTTVQQSFLLGRETQEYTCRPSCSKRGLLHETMKTIEYARPSQAIALPLRVWKTNCTTWFTAREYTMNSGQSRRRAERSSVVVVHEKA